MCVCICVCVWLPVILHKSACPHIFDKLGFWMDAAKILQLLEFCDHCWLFKSLLLSATVSWRHRLMQRAVCTCTVCTCRMAHGCLLWSRQCFHSLACINRVNPGHIHPSSWSSLQLLFLGSAQMFSTCTSRALETTNKTLITNNQRGQPLDSHEKTVCAVLSGWSVNLLKVSIEDGCF